jgi:hypothetical protein
MPIRASSRVLGMVCFFCYSVHPLTGNSHLFLFTFKITSFISLQLYGYSTEGVCWNIIYCSVFIPVHFNIIYYNYRFWYIWAAESITFLTVCSHVVATRLLYSYNLCVDISGENDIMFTT